MKFDDPWVFIVPPALMVSLLIIVSAGVNLVSILFPVSRIAGAF